ncbi:MAG: type I glyceraldehyde-3-phosphate dehydrogenase [Candidatus Babeliaceae bacterium]|nr:type I glyceraldehyde-3-phosphate dehydrogenase [Candidatus Babeliaceae bacterium]
MRIAINGFGRIGRSFLRVLLSDPKVREKIVVVAINVGGLDRKDTAHLFKYDTTMGQWKGKVAVEDDKLLIEGHIITLLAERDARKLPWEKLEIDWVVDCSGKYTDAADARQHLEAGAKKVLISAPATGPDCTIVPGVNDGAYDAKRDSIISLGSCTTNALMPMLKVIIEEFGIERAVVVTTHAYTNSQSLLDSGPLPDHDLRSYRAAPLNIIPHGTGASRLISEFFPQLDGRVSARALRVPVSNVSLLEVSWVAPREMHREMVNEAFYNAAAKGSLRGIVETSSEQLVSSDFIGDSASVIIDEGLTSVSGSLGTVFGWYDNEWGYSCRLRDFLMIIGPSC